MRAAAPARRRPTTPRFSFVDDFWSGNVRFPQKGPPENLRDLLHRRYLFLSGDLAHQRSLQWDNFGRPTASTGGPYRTSGTSGGSSPLNLSKLRGGAALGVAV